MLDRLLVCAECEGYGHDVESVPHSEDCPGAVPSAPLPALIEFGALTAAQQEIERLTEKLSKAERGEWGTPPVAARAFVHKSQADEFAVKLAKAEARAETAEAERGEWRSKAEHFEWVAEKLRAENEQLRAERDKLREKVAAILKRMETGWPRSDEEAQDLFGELDDALASTPTTPEESDG